MTGSEPAAARIAAIAQDPRYRDLVRRRARFSWMLTGVMLVVFFGYMMLVAFHKALLAQPVFGGTTSLGIPLGIGVILVGILLTGVYVRRANRQFDPEVRAILADSAP
jgi:uncharacterized membrane protein (DUF485 family)